MLALNLGGSTLGGRALSGRALCGRALRGRALGGRALGGGVRLVRPEPCHDRTPRGRAARRELL